MSDFYRNLRKAELHLHLEGSVEPETVLELEPSLSLEEVRAKYQFQDFAGFIRSYVWINRLLRQPSDYGLITDRLLRRLIAENIEAAEINISAGVILWKEQDFHHIFEEIRQSASRLPIRVGWVLDAVRQFGAEPAMRVAELAVEYQQQGVIGFGIGGDEPGGPAEWFRDVFAFVKENGLALLPHAGETAGSESVWACIRMGADRIGHGIRASEDAELMEHLRDQNIPLEVCVTSNVCTGAVESLDRHPLRTLFESGVPLTLNTDDPALFRTDLSNEFGIAEEHFGFSRDELRQIADNAFRYSKLQLTAG